MSLINRMLRDLSTRAPENGNVLSGIQVRGPQAGQVGGSLRRILTLVVLVVAFTAALWKFMPRPKLPVPTPRVAASSAGTVVASAAPAPSAPSAPSPAPGASHLKMDPTLSPPAVAEAPAPAAAKPAPAPRHRPQPATLKLDSGNGAAPAKLVSKKPAVKSAPVPAPAAVEKTAPAAAPASSGSRDARAAQLRYAEAVPALKRGEVATGERSLREALELDPSLHAAREALVALLLDQNRLDEAQAVLSAGLPYDPQRIAYRRLGARLDLARGEAQLARARLEPSPPAVGADPEYHGLLAAAYERLSRFQDAARVYESLIQVQPGEGHWWAGLGIARDGLGDRPGALAAYGQARTLGNLDARLLEHINKRTAALQSAD